MGKRGKGGRVRCGEKGEALRLGNRGRVSGGEREKG